MSSSMTARLTKSAREQRDAIKLRLEIALHMVDAQIRMDIMVDNLDAVYGWVIDRSKPAPHKK